jgi:hypothetical protein
MKLEFVLPEDSDLEPCPQACGRMTEDPYGGPCSHCWAALDAVDDFWDELITEDGAR